MIKILLRSLKILQIDLVIWRRSKRDWNWKEDSLLDHLKLHLQLNFNSIDFQFNQLSSPTPPYSGHWHWQAEVGVVVPPKPDPLEDRGCEPRLCTFLSHLHIYHYIIMVEEGNSIQDHCQHVRHTCNQAWKGPTTFHLGQRFS